MFATALLAALLARRSAPIASIARQRMADIRHLTTLNDRIIQQMAIGLVLVDEERRIRLCNRAARDMLGLDRDPTGRHLSSAAPPLAWTLEAWQVSPSLSSEPFNVGQRSLLPRFNRLGHGLNTPVLIFLEDARCISEQAQQMTLAVPGRRVNVRSVRLATCWTTVRCSP
jgi:two-component system sensor histidine kinase PilS (NtrC family)